MRKNNYFVIKDLLRKIIIKIVNIAKFIVKIKKNNRIIT